MFYQTTKIKTILSKLIIASKCSKKRVVIKKTKITTDFLNLLQKKGFIYGYAKSLVDVNYYLVFLKSSESNIQLLANVTLCNKYCLYKEFNFFEKNSLYLIITKKCYYLGTINKKNKISGCIIAKF